MRSLPYIQSELKKRDNASFFCSYSTKGSNTYKQSLCIWSLKFQDGLRLLPPWRGVRNSKVDQINHLDPIPVQRAFSRGIGSPWISTDQLWDFNHLTMDENVSYYSESYDTKLNFAVNVICF